MESIGTKLKKAREAKGVSIDEAQKETRIHNRILAALEDDRPGTAVSGTVYIKSFIKKYADYLGLDGAALAEEYKAAGPSRVNEQVAALRSARPSFRFPFKGIFVVVIASVVVFFGIRLAIFTGSKIKEGLKSRPKAVKKAEVPKPKLRLAPEAAKPAAVPVTAPVPQGENIIFRIKAKNDVYIKLKADGSVIYDGILKKGADETWEAKDSLNISTSRAEAIAAELNGKPLGALGNGVAKGILITRDGLKLPK